MDSASSPKSPLRAQDLPLATIPRPFRPSDATCHSTLRSIQFSGSNSNFRSSHTRHPPQNQASLKQLHRHSPIRQAPFRKIVKDTYSSPHAPHTTLQDQLGSIDRWNRTFVPRWAKRIGLKESFYQLKPSRPRKATLRFRSIKKILPRKILSGNNLR